MTWAITLYALRTALRTFRFHIQPFLCRLIVDYACASSKDTLNQLQTCLFPKRIPLTLHVGLIAAHPRRWRWPCSSQKRLFVILFMKSVSLKCNYVRVSALIEQTQVRLLSVRWLHSRRWRPCGSNCLTNLLRRTAAPLSILNKTWIVNRH